MPFVNSEMALVWRYSAGSESRARLEKKTIPAMKEPDIVEIVLEVVRVFESLGIDYYIGGSLASSAFGIARSTMDIDIAAQNCESLPEPADAKKSAFLPFEVIS